MSGGRQIEVEFFGVPRQRAGVDRVCLPLSGRASNLGEVLRQLQARFPDLLADPGVELPAAFVANLNGDRFVRASATVIAPGDTVLLMSADAGG